MKYGTVSAAPLATLATVALMPTAWSFGAITACAPAPSATRRQAPRLCGSVTPSRTRTSAGSPLASTASSVSSSEWLRATASTMRDDALMAIVAGEAAQALVVAVDEAHLGGLGARDELAHALVASAARRRAPRRPSAAPSSGARRPRGSRTGGGASSTDGSDQPEQADQHRLVQHVEAQAPAAEDGERPRSARQRPGEHATADARAASRSPPRPTRRRRARAGPARSPRSPAGA